MSDLDLIRHARALAREGLAKLEAGVAQRMEAENSVTGHKNIDTPAPDPVKCPQCGLPNPNENPYCFCKAPDPVKEAARVLLDSDATISVMAKAMHDGPLGADDVIYRPDNQTGTWCIQMARAALRALIDTPTPDPVKEAARAEKMHRRAQKAEGKVAKVQHAIDCWRGMNPRLDVLAKSVLRDIQRALADKGDT